MDGEVAAASTTVRAHARTAEAAIRRAGHALISRARHTRGCMPPLGKRVPQRADQGMRGNKHQAREAPGCRRRRAGQGDVVRDGDERRRSGSVVLPARRGASHPGANGERKGTGREEGRGGERRRTRSQVGLRQPCGWDRLRSQREDEQSMMASTMCRWKCYMRALVSGRISAW